MRAKPETVAYLSVKEYCFTKKRSKRTGKSKSI